MLTRRSVAPREAVNPVKGLCCYVLRSWRGQKEGLPDPGVSTNEHKRCRALWIRVQAALKASDDKRGTLYKFIVRALKAYHRFQSTPNDLTRRELRRTRYAHRRVIAGLCEERDLLVAGEVKAALYREQYCTILHDGAAYVLLTLTCCLQ